jgi:hypothetical protein
MVVAIFCFETRKRTEREMGIFLGIVGVLMVFAGFADGFTTHPLSAPQQAVQYLSFVVGSLGFVVIGVGAAVSHLVNIAELLSAAEDRSKEAAANTGEMAATPVLETY